MAEVPGMLSGVSERPFQGSGGPDSWHTLPIPKLLMTLQLHRDISIMVPLLLFSLQFKDPRTIYPPTTTTASKNAAC